MAVTHLLPMTDRLSVNRMNGEEEEEEMRFPCRGHVRNLIRLFSGGFPPGSEPSSSTLPESSHKCATVSCGSPSADDPPRSAATVQRPPLVDIPLHTNGQCDKNALQCKDGTRAAECKNGLILDNADLHVEQKLDVLRVQQNVRRPVVAQKPLVSAGRKPASKRPPASDKTNGSSCDSATATTKCVANGDAVVVNGSAALVAGPCDAGSPNARRRNDSSVTTPGVVQNGEGLHLELSAANVVNDTPTPCKDGVYFLAACQREHDHLETLCQMANRDLDSSQLPDEVEGKMRAAVGKAHLLTNKKFKQFRGLCQNQIAQTSEDRFQTTSQDLAGFWDMVLLQVNDVRAMFDELDALRRNDWQLGGATKVKTVSSDTISVKSASKSTGGGKKKATRLAKEAAGRDESTRTRDNARDEARRRLLAAKRAGRQRKASQSDKDVEIFVS